MSLVKTMLFPLVAGALCNSTLAKPANEGSTKICPPSPSIPAPLSGIAHLNHRQARLSQIQHPHGNDPLGQSGLARALFDASRCPLFDTSCDLAPTACQVPRFLTCGARHMTSSSWSPTSLSGTRCISVRRALRTPASRSIDNKCMTHKVWQCFKQ